MTHRRSNVSAETEQGEATVGQEAPHVCVHLLFLIYCDQAWGRGSSTPSPDSQPHRPNSQLKSLLLVLVPKSHLHSQMSCPTCSLSIKILVSFGLNFSEQAPKPFPELPAWEAPLRCSAGGNSVSSQGSRRQLIHSYSVRITSRILPLAHGTTAAIGAFRDCTQGCG